MELNPANADAERELRETRLAMRTRVNAPADGQTDLQLLLERARTLTPSGPELPDATLHGQVATSSAMTAALLYRTIGQIAGVSIVFDSQFRDGPAQPVLLNNLPLRDALDAIARATQTFYQVTAPGTITVINDTPAKRREYAEEVIAVIPIQNADLKEVMDVPSQEGLTVKLEVSALYHLDPEKAADVYRTVGTEYAEVILLPQFRSVTRGVTAQYEARALYTSEREKLADTIASDLRKLVEPRGIAVEATPLRQLTLPPRLAAAIEEKLGADQESQRMQFVLAKERQEAERRRIEAQGIADFQRIVTTGINDQLLRWKGIEATLKIAESQNSKVVIVGAGKDGLPVILGNQ